MSEKVEKSVSIVYSADDDYYCVPEVFREGGIWISAAKFPLPVAPGYRRPGVFPLPPATGGGGAVVMRGRNYYRTFSLAALPAGKSEPIHEKFDMVEDWRDAAWWTPGLEEAWAELEGLNEAISSRPDTCAASSAPGEDCPTRQAYGDNPSIASAGRTTENETRGRRKR